MFFARFISITVLFWFESFLIYLSVSMLFIKYIKYIVLINLNTNYLLFFFFRKWSLWLRPSLRPVRKVCFEWKMGKHRIPKFFTVMTIAWRFHPIWLLAVGFVENPSTVRLTGYILISLGLVATRMSSKILCLPVNPKMTLWRLVTSEKIFCIIMLFFLFLSIKIIVFNFGFSILSSLS